MLSGKSRVQEEKVRSQIFEVFIESAIITTKAVV
jgi:hypothetical protein